MRRAVRCVARLQTSVPSIVGSVECQTAQAILAEFAEGLPHLNGTDTGSGGLGTGAPHPHSSSSSADGGDGANSGDGSTAVMEGVVEEGALNCVKHETTSAAASGETSSVDQGGMQEDEVGVKRQKVEPDALGARPKVESGGEGDVAVDSEELSSLKAKHEVR